MTPSETYAQKREEAIELIRAHAPARLQDSLIELLRPAIALTATRANDDEIPLGTSKFGGTPDVPEGFVWPTWNEKPLGFLAQINLEEVAPFDVENLLPKSGLLSFFHRFGGLWGDDSGLSRVFWWDGELQRCVKVLDPRQGKQHIVPPCPLTLSPLWTLPDTDAPDFQSGISEFEWEDWNDVFYEIFDSEPPRHQILGHPLFVQAHEKEIEEELLFQMDSQRKDWMWGDVGKIYFFIQRHSLATRDFSSAKAIFQCH